MLVGTQPPDLAQIKDWEMKKVLHFAFPDEELELVEWRFIFCERFPGAGEPLVDTRGSSGSRKKILPAACQEILHQCDIPEISCYQCDISGQCSAGQE